MHPPQIQAVIGMNVGASGDAASAAQIPGGAAQGAAPAMLLPEAEGAEGLATRDDEEANMSGPGTIWTCQKCTCDNLGSDPRCKICDAAADPDLWTEA